MTSPREALAPGAVYLGFDYGAKRIGVAVGDEITRLARPLPAINNGRQPDWTALAQALKDWRPSAVVVGLPIDLDGNDQAITTQARSFADQLRRRYGVPVHLCDERMSSRAADDEIRSARADGRKTRRVQKGERDGVAARLILEQWLGEQPRAAAKSMAPEAATAAVSTSLPPASDTGV
jgi:putative holliday junction resolvase